MPICISNIVAEQIPTLVAASPTFVW